MSEAPTPKPGPLAELFGKGVTTGYRCGYCGHWNSLKRRKGFAEWKMSQLLEKP
jgi:hypothetical protein